MKTLFGDIVNFFLYPFSWWSDFWWVCCLEAGLLLCYNHVCVKFWHPSMDVLSSGSYFGNKILCHMQKVL